MQDQQSTLAGSRLEKKNVLSQIRKVLLLNESVGGKGKIEYGQEGWRESTLLL